MRGIYVAKSVLTKAAKAKAEGSKVPIKTWSRRSVIIDEMIGLKFNVYNGKKFIPVEISEGMLGRKLGEFSMTRFFKGHPEKKAATTKK